ncbi:MAG: hypothetical protein QOG70_2230 [Solirubrobacteraceae bacterium]|jgi:hypothetical protein|nr:hypothetical protein [Solirubrobacteraceae bacterium]
MRTRVLVPTIIAAAVAAGCGSAGGARAQASGGGGGLPQGTDPVTLHPADFSTRIDNPHWPMPPGSRWIYSSRGDDGRPERVVVVVTHRTKVVAAGVRAVVVHDVASQRGAVVEDTQDWYAQDRAGNVWYLGEATTEFKHGEADTAGSWEAGVDGAQAGVVMAAHPRVGLRYRQEHYAGQAEDRAVVVRLDGRADVPFGRLHGLLETKEYTPLEPGVVEHKLYADGVGPVVGGSDRLVSYRRGR